MTTYATAKDIINNVAVEVGLTSVSDPFTSTDKSFVQLVSLLNTAGKELIAAHEWQQLVKEHSIVTAVPPDTGDYDLPSDFGYMIDQSGWDFTNDVPLIGPLSDAHWKYLEGSDLVSSTIYVSFRLAKNKFSVFPQPPPDALTIKFEYISNKWVDVNGGGSTFDTKCIQAADVPLYEEIVIQKFLKLKWLSAKGFDTSSAMEEFRVQFELWSGNARSAPILNLVGSTGYPLLDTNRNLPDKGYGV